MAGRAAAEFSMVEDLGKLLKGALVCYNACLKETMFIHPVTKDKSIGIKEIFKGSPEEIVLQTIDRVAQLLLRYV